jgi:hypothetical protein
MFVSGLLRVSFRWPIAAAGAATTGDCRPMAPRRSAPRKPWIARPRSTPVSTSSPMGTLNCYVAVDPQPGGLIAPFKISGTEVPFSRLWHTLSERLQRAPRSNFFVLSMRLRNFALFCDQARNIVFFGLALLAISTVPVHAVDTRQSDASQGGGPVGEVTASPAVSSEASLPAAPAEVAFDAARRAVSNWLPEAIDNLDLSANTKGEMASKTGTLEFPRCVMLNNYWCIKRARWAGEIAADAEGHVAFASAMDGATAAVMLLRRYYLDYNRRSALAILSRWAPPQCAGGAAAMGRTRKLRTGRLATLAGLAPRSIQNTLHARWLAAHRQGFSPAGKPMAPRRSVVPSWPLVLMRAPEIAVGMGEPRRAPIPLKKFAALDFAAPVTPVPGLPCGSENTRIQNYAARAIDGIAADPNGDLNLFLADGTAGANLPRLLQNMAKVEIGPWAAQARLIAAAIDHLTPRSVATGSPRPVDSHGGASNPRE